MKSNFPESYLETVIRIFKGQKKLAEKAMQQLEDNDFHTCIDSESTSVAIIVKHLAGNMRSRWRDFLTSDGEKLDRDRDSEFVDDFQTTLDIWNTWEAGWHTLITTLEALEPEDLGKTITIRSEPHIVMEAIQRQLSHYAYHVGQIVFLCRHLSSGTWQTLSIARGESETYNQTMLGKASRK